MAGRIMRLLSGISCNFFAAQGFGQPFSTWVATRSTPLHQLHEILQLEASHRKPALYSQCLELMNNIDLKHLGLSESQIMRFTKNVCMDVYSCTDYCITLFIIPANSGFPLHDHVSMSVLSKVLLGKLKTRSFTLRESFKVPQQDTLATLVLDKNIGTMDPAWMLSETGACSVIL